MAPKGYYLTPDAFNRTKRAVSHVERYGAPRGAREQERDIYPVGVTIRDAELTANLSAASNSKTGAATAAAKFLVPDPDNAGDLMDGDAFTVTNRSLDATGLSGDYIVVAKIAGEWRPIWIDC